MRASSTNTTTTTTHTGTHHLTHTGGNTTSSSAYPPGGKKPRFFESVHNIDFEEIQNCSLHYNSLTLQIDPKCNFIIRTVNQETDQEILKLLHQEWFPINYQAKYYQSIYDNTFDSFIIEYKKSQPPPLSGGGGGGGGPNHFFSYFYELFNPTPTTPLPNIASFACVAYDNIISDEDIVRLYSALFRRGDHNPASRECDKMIDQVVYEVYNNCHHDLRNNLRAKAAYIVTLGVTAEFRHKGLAAYMLKRLKRRIAAKHKMFLYLHCVCYNEDAINMYYNHGFMFAGNLKAYYDIDGVNYDALLLVWFAPENMDSDVQEFIQLCNNELVYMQSNPQERSSPLPTLMGSRGSSCANNISLPNSRSSMNSP